jgi:pSer/pThr/pTyr-binding forkhead associated (FHA) protein
MIRDGRRYAFKTPFVIGRTKGNLIFPEDSRISQVHCEIRRNKGGYLLIDKGSRNGCTVNGQKVKPNEAIEVRAGDVIVIGDQEINLYEEHAPEVVEINVGGASSPPKAKRKEGTGGISGVMSRLRNVFGESGATKKKK